MPSSNSVALQAKPQLTCFCWRERTTHSSPFQPVALLTWSSERLTGLKVSLLKKMYSKGIRKHKSRGKQTCLANSITSCLGRPLFSWVHLQFYLASNICVIISAIFNSRHFRNLLSPGSKADTLVGRIEALIWGSSRKGGQRWACNGISGVRERPPSTLNQSRGWTQTHSQRRASLASGMWARDPLAWHKRSLFHKRFAKSVAMTPRADRQPGVKNKTDRTQ